MSYTEYLRNKAAAQKKTVDVQRPMDASSFTNRQRLAATRVFPVDGSGVGTLLKTTDRNINNNAAVSSKKQLGRPGAASDYTSYAGSRASNQDIVTRNTVSSKELPCVAMPVTVDTMKNASSRTNAIASCPSERGAPISDIQFVDNTISLNSMTAKLSSATSGTCFPVNHTHSPGLSIAVNPTSAPGKPFFMASPPKPQGPNVSPNKVGGYLGHRSAYVERKHGYVKPTGPTPVAPGGQGQYPAQLKINNPTFGIVKP
jgi:hypothetical protein